MYTHCIWMKNVACACTGPSNTSAEMNITLFFCHVLWLFLFVWSLTWQNTDAFVPNCLCGYVNRCSWRTSLGAKKVNKKHGLTSCKCIYADRSFANIVFPHLRKMTLISYSCLNHGDFYVVVYRRFFLGVGPINFLISCMFGIWVFFWHYRLGLQCT